MNGWNVCGELTHLFPDTESVKRYYSLLKIKCILI